VYIRFPSIAAVPTFDTSSSLEEQLGNVGDLDCVIQWNGQTHSYEGDTSSCTSPNTVLNLANSKFSENTFSLQMSVTVPFATEEAQTAF